MMVDNYKVVKEFGCAKVGEILRLIENEYILSESIDDANYYEHRSICVSPEVIKELVRDGFVVPLEPVVDNKDKAKADNTTDNLAKDTIIKALSYISQLKNTYNQRKNAMEKRNMEGKVQACVKLEHDTVYFNLMKVLNKLESILKNE